MYTLKFPVLLLAAIFLSVSCLGAGQKSRSRQSSKRPARPPTLSVKTLKAKITRIINEHNLDVATVGVQVMDLASGRVVYDYNSLKLYHPASNTKVITTAAAVATMPRHEFATTVSAVTPLRDSVITGNLFVKGSGDPVFGTNDLDSLAKQLYAKGVRRIEGDLVGDASRFDTVAWGAGWMWDDEPSSDEPFITPLSVNANKIVLTVSPGIVAGAKPLYTMFPDTRVISVTNNAVTGIDSLGKLKADRRHGMNDVTLTGPVAPRAAAKEYEVSISDPARFFLEHFRERLALNGITVAGITRFGPASGASLASIVHSLDTVITFVNKESNNLGAEGLVKTLGAETYAAPGSWQNGLPVVKKYLNRIGIDTTGIILADGSGVSFYNLFSPSNMVTILADRYRDEKNFDRFYNSLPVAALDGTLKNRMRATKAAGNVHAKTGTITGVSALSGYVHDAGERIYAFSIMFNHYPGETKVMRDAQDEILEAIAGSVVSF